MIRPHAIPAQTNNPSNTTLLRPDPKNVTSGVLMHSYLVDVNSGADEETRAAVKLLEVEPDDRIEGMSFHF